MPTVHTIGGLKIRIYFGDHDAPHIHVFDGGLEARVEIATGRHMEGEIKSTSLRKVAAWLAANRAAVLATFLDYQKKGSKP